MRLAHTWKEAEDAKAAGKLYAFLGVEGMAAIGKDLRGIDWYYDAGVRTAMLTWNEENALATGAGGEADIGLTGLGRQAVGRMQEKRMLVDVSHLNDGGFWEVMKLTQAPVIASHSNCRALCDVRRNLTDEQLRALRDVNGVVGLNAYHGFIHTDPGEQTAKMLAQHAAHMADVMGVEHVGCGFDFCHFMGPGNEGGEGLEDAGQIKNLFYWLEKLGMTAAERNKIACGNFERVLRETLDLCGGK